MENKRTRKIYYEFNEWNKKTLDVLKNIDCKYHIFGILEQNSANVLKGYIYFINPKTISKLKDNVFLKENVNLFHDDYDEDYSLLENIWESGTKPCQGRKKQTKKDTTIAKISETKSMSLESSAILNQNTTLIEQSKEICHFLMKQNQQLLEENKQLKQVSTTITNNIEKMENNTNIENKTFNVNVFLNEDCKNALTLADFVNSLKIEDSDLFLAKERGLSEAIMNVFKRGLQNCDINTRPLHCTDTKRETLHIKDQDGWVREYGPDSAQMKKAICNISNKKIYKLSQYMKENPDGFKNVVSPDYEECLKMMRSVMGADENKEKTEKKIIKDIVKSVYINSESIVN
jgi:hypothetical protein